MYFYDSDVQKIASELKPSSRGELEITDVNQAYLDRGTLSVQHIGRGTAWLDGGSHHDLYEAGQFVKVVEERSGMKIAVPEEIAWRKGFISDEEFAQIASNPKSAYDHYLHKLHLDNDKD